TYEPGIMERIAPLSGVSADVIATANRKSFAEALLFTHRGLSGPAILQISSYWREGDPISINLLPGLDLAATLALARTETPKYRLQTVLSELMPRRLAQMMAEDIGIPNMIGDFSDKKIAVVVEAIQHWTTKPTGSEGYRTAEVTLGGVDTRDLD